MNLVTVKDISKIKLDNIALEWIGEDGSVREVRIRSKSGVIVIRASGYGEVLKVFTEAPPEVE